MIENCHQNAVTRSKRLLDWPLKNGFLNIKVQK